MPEAGYLLIVLGMGLVTYIPRLLPLLFFSRRDVPDWFADWLEFVPPAILSALLIPSLVAADTGIDFTRRELWVALPTFAVSWFTKSLGGTVLAGMAFYWLSGLFWG
ncbi:MAG: AzlD domain-containing protein [Desulfatibacillaceae bacterium]